MTCAVLVAIPSSLCASWPELRRAFEAWKPERLDWNIRASPKLRLLSQRQFLGKLLGKKNLVFNVLKQGAAKIGPDWTRKEPDGKRAMRNMMMEMLTNETRYRPTMTNLKKSSLGEHDRSQHRSAHLYNHLIRFRVRRARVFVSVGAPACSEFISFPNTSIPKWGRDVCQDSCTVELSGFRLDCA